MWSRLWRLSEWHFAAHKRGTRELMVILAFSCVCGDARKTVYSGPLVLFSEKLFRENDPEKKNLGVQN